MPPTNTNGQLHDISVAIGGLQTNVALLRGEVQAGFTAGSKKMDGLADRIDALERKEDLRQGGTNLRDWTIKNLPSLSAVFVVVFSTVIIILKQRGLL